MFSYLSNLPTGPSEKQMRNLWVKAPTLIVKEIQFCCDNCIHGDTGLSQESDEYIQD